MKKVLVLCSSPRVQGNTEILANEFIKGAVEAGNQVEYVRLADKKIGLSVERVTAVLPIIR